MVEQVESSSVKESHSNVESSRVKQSHGRVM